MAPARSTTQGDSCRNLSFLVRGLAALLAVTVSSICGAQETSPGSQWLSYNNHLDGQRFSPLKEITPANATQLGEVCRVQIDGPTSLHSDLIVVDGVIYHGYGPRNGGARCHHLCPALALQLHPRR